MSVEQATVCAIPDFGVLRISGSDAGRYLDAQLSQDLASLPPDRAPLAGWHDPRGRVKALFRVLRRSDDYLLLTDRSVVDTVIGDLRRYVLRADVAVSAVSDWTALAMVDCSDDWLRGNGVDLASEPGSMLTQSDTWWIRVGPSLVHRIGPAPILAELPGDQPGQSELAEYEEIGLGIPRVSAQFAGEFVAQMLNLDRLGAVAFDKGCYPGQEIIARSQHLGEVKRRACVFEYSALPVPIASAVLDSAGTAIGKVIRVGVRNGRGRMLAVVRLDRLGATVHLDDQHATRLERVRTTVTDAPGE